MRFLLLLFTSRFDPKIGLSPGNIQNARTVQIQKNSSIFIQSTEKIEYCKQKYEEFLLQSKNYTSERSVTELSPNTPREKAMSQC